MAAVITEHPKSGEGDRAGATGAYATRLFIVQLDAVDDEPEGTLAAVHPLGSLHPKPSYSGLGIVDYEHEEVLDYQARLHLVRAIYGVPLVALQAQWNISYHAATEFMAIARDLDGKMVGGRAFRLPDEPQVGPPEPPTHFATGSDGNPRGLVALPNAVNPLPLNVYGRTIGVTARRRIANFNGSIRRNLLNYFGRVNSDAGFLDFDKYQCLFLHAEIEPVPGELTGQITDNVVYDVTLEFLGRPEPWTPVRIYDTFEVEGYEALVTWASGPTVGQASYQDFKAYIAVPLNGIFSLLSGAPFRVTGVIRP